MGHRHGPEDRPARVAAIDVRLQLSPGFPEAKRDRLMAVVEHRTVHNSLVRLPDVRIVAEAVIPARST